MKASRLWALPLVLTLASCNLGEYREGRFSRTLQVSGPVTLDVESGAGNISVRVGNDHTVTVTGRIRARGSFSGMSAESKVDKLRSNPPIEQEGNFIHIGKIVDRDLLQNVHISYEVYVPAQTRLTTKTGAGNQTIAGTQLSLDAWSGAGSISVSDIGGNADIHTGAGSVEVRSPQGTLTAETGAGSVTAKGDPRHDWRIEVGAGSIRLEVPLKSSFDLQAESGFGRVRVNPQLKVDGSVAGSRVHGKVGDGGAMVRLSSGAGTIDVE
jgi:DUF4097 and DUF4098 domain-containing protein YvlB